MKTILVATSLLLPAAYAVAAVGELDDWDFISATTTAGQSLDALKADRGTGDSELSFATVIGGSGTFRGTDGTLSASDGNLLIGTYGPGTEWTRTDTFGTGGDVSSVTRLPDGTTVVCGTIGTSAEFGVGWPGDPVNGVTYTSTSTQDGFLALYSSTGAFSLLRKFGGIPTPLVDSSPDGPIYVTGKGTNADLYFGSTLRETTPQFRYYLVKASQYAAYGWSRSATGGYIGPSAHVAALVDGSALWTGTFAVSSVIDDGAGGSTTLTANGWAAYLVKYSKSGVLQWAKQADGDVVVYGLAADDEDNSYLLALADGTVTFGPGEAGERTVTYDDDWVVARFLSDGTFDWVRRIAPKNGVSPTPGYLYATGISAGTASQGAAVVGYYFTDDVTVFSGTPAEEVWPYAGSFNESWVVGLRANNSVRFDRQITGAHTQWATDVHFDPLRAIVTVTGDFIGNITLGNGDPNGPYAYQLAGGNVMAGFFADHDSGVAP